MKELIRSLAIAACFITENAFGQGTVNFLNDSVTLSSPPDRLIRFGAFPGVAPGTPAFGTNFQVQLYYGLSTSPESQLIAVTSAPARLRASSSTATGTWSGGGFRTLTGFGYGAGTVNLQVRLWDIRGGATYEEAIGSPSPFAFYSAKSAVFQYLIPSSAGAPGGDFAMKNFVGFLIDIPEPSSLAVLVLGAGVLIIGRRRKLY